MDWRTGLSQGQVCETLMGNGAAFWLLEKAMEDATKGDHLTALSRHIYFMKVPSLDPSLIWTHSTAVFLLGYLKESDRVITYEKKEVGSLVRFPSGTAGNEQGIALVDYLLKVPSMMTLNDAQIVELEYLLNKAGETLGVTLPVVHSATANEQEAALRAVAFSALQAKPKVYYQKYLDELKARGTPVTMTREEFSRLATDTLSSFNSLTL